MPLLREKPSKEVLCRICGVPLLTKVEIPIGVHIACVQESQRRIVRRIPMPSYRTQQHGNDDPE